MILSAEHVSVSIAGTDILEDISFSVDRGEYVCVVGENGSGKSTLMRTLLGKIPVKSGKITFDPRAGRIGYLPQQNMIDRNFPASVSEVVLSGCLNQLGLRPFYGKKEKQEAEAVMKRLNITDLADRPFGVLSGGQKQRVLLARALCATENLLLLDEPVTGLDPLVTEELYELIREMNEERGLTVLMVSHDIRAAVKYAGRVLHVGKTVRFFGSTQEYLSTELGIHFSGRCCDHV